MICTLIVVAAFLLGLVLGVPIGIVISEEGRKELPAKLRGQL